MELTISNISTCPGGGHVHMTVTKDGGASKEITLNKSDFFFEPDDYETVLIVLLRGLIRRDICCEIKGGESMSYETRDEQLKRDQEYQELKKRKSRIEAEVSNWIDTATALHTDSPLQTDKNDIVSQRNAFIVALSNSLGV